jgi:serine/threonine protein kinase
MEEKTLSNIIDKFKITLKEVSEFLTNEGYEIEILPETKISNEIYLLIQNRFNFASNPTNVYSDNQDNTTTYEDNNTSLYNEYQNSTKNYTGKTANLRTKKLNLRTGDKIILKKNEFNIIDVISDQTKEAVIYKVSNQSNKIYVLKLYNEVSEKEEPNGETLELIKTIEDADILELIDFGVGYDKYKGKYCFEISAFAEGGDLLNVENFKEKYTSSFIEKNIVNEIFLGLKKLHENNIFHCDLKPSNIFYLDKEQTDIVIGDYGNAKIKDSNLKQDLHISSIVFATPFYVAPELASSKAISAKADYYSFGMILLHLLYPEQFANDNDYKSIDKYKLRSISQKVISSKEIVKYNPKYKRLNKLIAGLTLSVFDNRWGQNEVQKWIDGKDDELEVRYLSSLEKQAIINLSGNKTITTEDSLIEYIYSNENWKEEFFGEEDDKDDTTERELNDWLTINYSKDKRKEFHRILKYTKQVFIVDPKVAKNENIDYAKQAVIRLFKPEFPISINEETFTLTDGSINDNLNKLISKLDSVWYTFSIEKIRFILFQVETSLRRLMIGVNKEITFSLNNLLIKIYSGLNINKNEFDLTDFKSEITRVINLKDKEDSLNRIVNLFYAFDSERIFNYKKTSCKTIEDLGLFFVKNESLFKNPKVKAEKIRFLQKINKFELSNLPYQEFIFEIFKNEAVANIEYTSLTFDKYRDYKINYKYYKSLTEFFKTRGIQKDFTSRSDKTELFEHIRGVLQKFSSVCDIFIDNAKTKHNISQLTTSNENNIKKQFVSDSIRQYIKVYQGQLLALGILLLIIVGVMYNNNTKIYHSPPTQRTNTNVYSPTKAINRTAYIKADPIGNIRSGTSTNYSILTSLNKGEQIYVIEQDKTTSWYKVRYNGNNYGYVSDVVVSFDYVAKNSNTQSIGNNSIRKVNKNTLSKSTLTGSWKIDNGNSKYTFNSNGRGNYKNSRGKNFSFRWSINNNYLKITLNSDNSIWDWKINSFSSNRITMYSSKRKLNRTITKY